MAAAGPLPRAPKDARVLQRIVDGGRGGRAGAVAAADHAAARLVAGLHAGAAALHAAHTVQYAHRVDQVQVHVPAGALAGSCEGAC